MEFLIVSGLSGAGKSTVMSILEDSGFFCVDNLPPVLIPKFAEVCLAGAGSYERVAMVCDIRAGEHFDGLFQAMDALSAMEFHYKVLFVDADDTTIIKRYKETRRSHPLLAEAGSLSEAVERERAAIAETHSFLDRVYQGSVGLMMSAMARRQELSADEVAQLRAILDQIDEGGVQ